MRVLICTSEFPYPPMTGLRLPLAEALPHLSERHEVTVLGLRLPEQRDVPLPAGVRFHEIPSVRRGRLARGLSWLAGFVTCRPVQAVGLRTQIGPVIRQTMSEETFDVVHVTGAALAEVISELDGVPAVIVPLDAWHVNAQASTSASRGLIRLLRTVEQRRVVAFERRMFPKYNSVIVVSKQDVASLEGVGVEAKFRVVPNGVNVTQFASGAWQERKVERILFVGTLRWEPNVRAARFLCHEVLPRVRDHYPTVEVVIVGRAVSEELRDELDALPGVTVIGEVPDVSPWLREAGVFCAPMLDGTGIKNKVLEAMSCGAPAVVTPLGAQGLDVKSGRELIVSRPDAASVADAIIGVLGDSSLREALSVAGRSYVEKSHGWQAVAEQLTEAYQLAISHR